MSASTQPHWVVVCGAPKWAVDLRKTTDSRGPSDLFRSLLESVGNAAIIGQQLENGARPDGGGRATLLKGGAVKGM